MPEPGDSFALLRAEQEARRAMLPPAADFHRLPLEWYRAKASELRAQARERGVDGGLLLTNRWNIIYATGLFHTSTERPFACFLPADDDDAVFWLHPHLDAELVRTWWCTEAFSYFDHHDARGGRPDTGTVDQGDTVDLFRWWGETLAGLGYGDRTIGVDSGGLAEIGIMPGGVPKRLDFFAGDVAERRRPEDGPVARIAEAMPDAWFIDVSDLLVRRRAVKDEQETALTQRAIDLLSEVHAFARDYLRDRGAGCDTWELANAARAWGMERIRQALPDTAEPHETAGASLVIACRSGRATAYPHPNQVHWSRVARGDAVQIAGLLQLGGYGGELYRSFLVAPWTDWQEHVWEVHTRAYEIQAEESYAGNTCSNVARAVHEHQVARGCGHLVYHRPGHSQGSEGHQPPYHALGDYTVLRTGMHFSNEPGLYDVENGFGLNHGNNILVGERTGLQMGTAPATKEWCLLEL